MTHTIEQLEAMLAGATDGPWKVRPHWSDAGMREVAPTYPNAKTQRHWLEVAEIIEYGRENAEVETSANAALIAAAPTLATELIAALKREAQLREAEFKRGYLIACTNMMNLHDEPVIARDTLSQVQITQADIAAMDLTEYDADALAEIRAEPHGDPIKAATEPAP